MTTKPHKMQPLVLFLCQPLCVGPITLGSFAPEEISGFAGDASQCDRPLRRENSTRTNYRKHAEICSFMVTHSCKA